MKTYYVNNNPQPATGDHEVHVPDCRYFHMIKDRSRLGEFPSCQRAVAAAKEIYPTADGCAFCCPECHKR